MHTENKSCKDGVHKIVLGDFYAEESRDVLFEVTLASASNGSIPIPHVICKVDYVDVVQKRIVNTSNPVTASIARPSGSEVAPSNHHVATQWLRIGACDAMKEADALSSQGKFGQARAVIQKCLEAIRRETAEGVRSDPLTIQLINDLNESLQGLADKHTWSATGEMRMQTKLYSHARQRCYESVASPVPSTTYGTRSKKTRSLKFQAATSPKK